MRKSLEEFIKKLGIIPEEKYIKDNAQEEYLQMLRSIQKDQAEKENIDPGFEKERSPEFENMDPKFNKKRSPEFENMDPKFNKYPKIKPRNPIEEIVGDTEEDPEFSKYPIKKKKFL